MRWRWLWVAMGALGLASCGGRPASIPEPSSQAASASRARGPQDQSLQAPDAFAIRTSPMWPSQTLWPTPVTSKDIASASLSKLASKARRRRASADDVGNYAATLLQNADVSRANLDEARKLLKRFIDRRSAPPPPGVIELLALAEARAGEYEESLELLGRAAKGGPLGRLGAAVLLRSLLETREFDGARSVLAAAVESDPDPVHPYSRAWIRLALGDYLGAHRDMAVACRAWGPQLPAGVLGELALFAALSGTSVDESSALFAKLPGDARAKLRAQARGYRTTGAYEMALGAMSSPAGESSRAQERAVWHRRRSDLHYLSGEPDLAVQELVAALDLNENEACSAECMKKLRQRANQMARFFHTVYVTTQAEEYFEPARRLYQALSKSGENVAQPLRDLEHYRIGADPGQGLHSLEVLVPFVQAREEVVANCHALQTIRKADLSGSLVVVWAIDAKGRVTGASAEPAPGEEGLSAVSACVLERSRKWRFPGRSVPGETRLTVRYGLGT